MTQRPCVSAIGSLPGKSAREAVRMVRDLLVEPDIPFLPELPARGPGADLIGRTAVQLVDLGISLQPSGWRLADANGLDARRAQAFLGEDLDELAEAFDGYQGDLKVQWCGPWTLAANLELPWGERVLTDPGATRDLIQSLAEGVRVNIAKVQTLVPDARLIVQWDEPSLPAVLAGNLPTASGYGRVRSVDQGEVVDGMATVTTALGDNVIGNVLHCCAPNVPIALVRRVEGLALALDTSLVGARQWDGIAELVEGGRDLWAGAAATDGSTTRPEQVADPLLRTWRMVGLTAADLQRIVLTPACGLASMRASDVPRLVRTLVDAAELIAQDADRLSAG